MSLKVSKEAAKWYKNEMDLEAGDYLQYYVQIYGGIPTAHQNYSLGMSIGEDGHVAVKDEVEGIVFILMMNMHGFWMNSQWKWILKMTI